MRIRQIQYAGKGICTFKGALIASVERNDVTRQQAQVDEQHKHLVDLIAAVEAAAVRGEGAATVDAVLYHLLRFLDLHFETEERLMTESSYPGLAAHAREHQRCRQELHALIGDASSPSAEDLQRATGYLRRWFEHHQLTVDKAYLDFLTV